ncbi:MAG: hypothetical protein KF816_13200 [Melioribacteraceae bacterium]|nr:hypothetical protein [Melioribacteraceae bacterium]
MKNILIIIPLFIVLINACGTKDYVIVPEYRGQNISNASLLIPQIKQFKISQAENVFTEEQLMAINKDFSDELGQTLIDGIKSASTFQKVHFADLEGKVNFKETELVFRENEPIRINVPTKSVAFSDDDRIFILLFENLSCSIYRKQRETSNPAKHYTASSPTPYDVALTPAKLSDFVFSTYVKYLIYDNERGREVSYGKINIEEKIPEGVEMNKLLKKVINKLSEAIIKETPFEK